MVYAPTRELWEQVEVLAKRAGFDGIFHSPLAKGFVCGAWRDGDPDNKTLFALRWNDELFNQHPDWPRFDATTEMDAIIAHFSGEPAYDETPLPHDMNPELAKEIQKKFNLSPEQWDAIPPLAREALSGVQVVTEKVEVGTPHAWISVRDKLPSISNTVLVTNSVTGAIHSYGTCDVGYWDENEWCTREGLDPTHWCPLPGDTEVLKPQPEDDEEQPDSEEESDGQF